jgi:hypothetical protein
MVNEEVKLVFQMPQAEKVWTALQKIGLDTDVQIANFSGYYQGRRRADPYLQPRLVFLEWGEEQLQPVINRKLHRDHAHPTFAALMTYCLRQEIECRRSQYLRHDTDETKP